MPFTQVVTDKLDYLLFIGDGCIRNKEDFLEWCLAAITKAQQLHQKRLLFDNRTLTMELTQQDVIEVANRLVDMEAQTLGLRLAVISARESSELAHFIETSFTNRSAMYKRFGSQKEALSWLLA